MASKTPTYGKDLPGNLGTDGVLRAIYDEIQNGAISGDIDEKLNTICDQLVAVNNNIESNTQAIKDISINIDIHSKDIMSITYAIKEQTEAIKNIKIRIDTSELKNSIEKMSNTIENGFNKTNNAIENGFNETSNAIKSLEPRPQPRPLPPPPPPPYYPEPEPDFIFCPVPLGLPAPQIFNYRLPGSRTHINHNKCECKHTEKKSKPKVFVPEDQRPNNYKNFDPFHTPYNPYCPPFGSKKPDYKPKVTYPKHI